ncbi:Uncharacterised protein [uncultured archaeon]|nr:Uncharacterised protein [uncultured archaeon]
MINLIQKLFRREEKPRKVETLPEVIVENLDYEGLINLLDKVDLKVKIQVSYELPLEGEGHFKDVNALDLTDFIQREFKENSACFRYRTRAEHRITSRTNEEQHAVEVTKERLSSYIGNQEIWKNSGHEASIGYCLKRGEN